MYLIVLEKIEQDKAKRTESLKSRISMFEANRQKSLNPPPTSSNGSNGKFSIFWVKFSKIKKILVVQRTQSLKMAPTFLRDRSKGSGENAASEKSDERMLKKIQLL